MTITVTVTDSATGEAETREVPENDYFLLCTGTCYEAGVQAYPKSGTHVLTIKGWRPSSRGGSRSREQAY